MTVIVEVMCSILAFEYEKHVVRGSSKWVVHKICGTLNSKASLRFSFENWQCMYFQYGYHLHMSPPAAGRTSHHQVISDLISTWMTITAMSWVKNSFQWTLLLICKSVYAYSNTGLRRAMFAFLETKFLMMSWLSTITKPFPFGWICLHCHIATKLRWQIFRRQHLARLLSLPGESGLATLCSCTSPLQEFIALHIFVVALPCDVRGAYMITAVLVIC